MAPALLFPAGMNRWLVIDPDRATAQRIGLGCLDRGVGVVIAENLCEGVRTLLNTPVSLVVVDLSLLRLTPAEHATLFDRVAPGVPVVIAARANAPLDVRVAFELAGFRVIDAPVAVSDLVAKLAVEGGGWR